MLVQYETSKFNEKGALKESPKLGMTPHGGKDIFQFVYATSYRGQGPSHMHSMFRFHYSSLVKAGNSTRDEQRHSMKAVNILRHTIFQNMCAAGEYQADPL